MAATRFTVRYIPVEEGADVQIGTAGLPGVSGTHKIIGYQSAPLSPRARKAYEPHGWIVALVNEALEEVDRVERPRRLRARSRRLRVAS